MMLMLLVDLDLIPLVMELEVFSNVLSGFESELLKYLTSHHQVCSNIKYLTSHHQTLSYSSLCSLVPVLAPTSKRLTSSLSV